MWLSAKRWCDGEQQRCARALLLLRPATPARSSSDPARKFGSLCSRLQLRVPLCNTLPAACSLCTCRHVHLSISDPHPPAIDSAPCPLLGHVALLSRLVRCRLGSRTILSVSRYHVVLELPSAVYHLETRLPSVCERGGDACRPGASRLSRLHLVCTSVHEISKMGYLRSLLCAEPSCV